MPAAPRRHAVTSSAGHGEAGDPARRSRPGRTARRATADSDIPSLRAASGCG